MSIFRAEIVLFRLNRSSSEAIFRANPISFGWRSSQVQELHLSLIHDAGVRMYLDSARSCDTVSETLRDKRIRLLLLDDQALFRVGLAGYLSSQPGVEVVCECGGSAEALQVLAAAIVDVILLDLDRDAEVACGFMRAARRAGYQGRFLIVTAAADAGSSAIAIRLGASGIFLKSEAPDRMLQAIRLVADGAVWLDQKIIGSLADQLVHSPRRGRSSPNGLTERERQVLLGVLEGLTSRKIGDRIGVSEGAVKGSLQQLFSKVGVRTRSQLVRIALEGSLENVKTRARRSL